MPLTATADARRFAIGVDIGGTFTDCAIIDQATGASWMAKALTTPANPAEGFFRAIDAAAARLDLTGPELLQRTDRVIHGTTTGTNAIVTRQGARVGLLTTAGHGDHVRLMKGGARTRGMSPENLLEISATGKPASYIPPARVIEVEERIDRDGDVVVPISRDSVIAAVNSLAQQGVEAIAISFLWAVRNSHHERLARQWAAEVLPDVFISCGHEMAGTVGEFSRSMTTIMNAFIGPLMVRYVTLIEDGMRMRCYDGPLFFSQCGGGAITANDVRAMPIQTIQSGPVSGILASGFLGRQIGIPNIITADVGGTTLDVGLVHDGVEASRTRSIFERFELALPMLDLDSVGAGGGSIASVDDRGRLTVGPQSAGAWPGPIAFGRGGTAVTVSDADIVLGIIDPDKFLGGTLKLDKGAAEAAVDRLAERLGLGRFETAAAINRIVDARMGDLMRRLSLLRGHDPRDFCCFAFGGAGPPHAGAIGREAGVRKIVIPLLNMAAVWSAFGAAASDLVHVVDIPARLKLPASRHEIAAIRQELAKRVTERLAADSARAVHQFSVRMKYVAQVHDLLIPFAEDSDALLDNFERAYARRYGEGSGYSAGGVEITSAQVRAVVPVPKPALPRAARCARPLSIPTRAVYWSEFSGVTDTPALTVGDALPEGRFDGPFLIDLPDTVAAIRPGQSGYFDDYGNLVIEPATQAPVADRIAEGAFA